MTVLRVMASRHSAFYSPLIGTIAGGFLQEEGFEPEFRGLEIVDPMFKGFG